METMNLTDSISEFLSGKSTLKVDIGLSAESAIKFGVVAIITTLMCVLIAKSIK